MLESERLIYRAWTKEDAAALYELCKDPELASDSGFRAHTNIQESENIIRVVLSAEYTYCIVRKCDQAILGSICIEQGIHSLLNLPEGEVEIGYWLGKSARHQGYMQEALQRIVTFCFETLRCTKVYGCYYKGNHSSRDVMVQVGLEYERQILNLEVPAYACTRDLYVYSINPTRYREMRSAQRLWEAYRKQNPQAGYRYEVWRFGCAHPDELTNLVRAGIKTATASAEPLYEVMDSKIPEVGSVSIILQEDGEAVAILEDIEVKVVPFEEVDERQAYLEGEETRDLAYWRPIHEEIMTEEMKNAGLIFTPQILVVCEVFEVKYQSSCN